jgi:hypothetical protein
VIQNGPGDGASFMLSSSVVEACPFAISSAGLKL